jgi:hypothetical protein
LQNVPRNICCIAAVQASICTHHELSGNAGTRLKMTAQWHMLGGDSAVFCAKVLIDCFKPTECRCSVLLLV